MKPIIGHIPEFYGIYDEWNVYEERLEQFFVVNEIPEDKWTAVLISCIGRDTYKDLRDLCHPLRPKDKTFEELCVELRKHYNRQICIFRERAQFYLARQRPDESINSWYARIKCLSVDCKFHQHLESVLLDKFITGLKSGPVLDRICEENETTTLVEALQICVSKECAIKDPDRNNDDHNYQDDNNINYDDDNNNNDDNNADVLPICGKPFRPQIQICPPAPPTPPKFSFSPKDPIQEPVTCGFGSFGGAAPHPQMMCDSAPRISPPRPPKKDRNVSGDATPPLPPKPFDTSNNVFANSAPQMMIDSALAGSALFGSAPKQEVMRYRGRSLAPEVPCCLMRAPEVSTMRAAPQLKMLRTAQTEVEYTTQPELDEAVQLEGSAPDLIPAGEWGLNAPNADMAPAVKANKRKVRRGRGRKNKNQLPNSEVLA